MPSKSQIKANNKYNKNNYDTFLLRIPKGTKSALQNYLFSQRDNISLNKYIIDLIEKDIDQKLSDL